MRNITVSVTDDVYRSARIWAAQCGTSLSNVVRYLLSTMHRLPRAQAAFPMPGAAGATAPSPAPVPPPLPAAQPASDSVPVAGAQERCVQTSN